MYEPQRCAGVCVCVCVLQGEAGARGRRWMDKDNKRGKETNTPKHTHKHTQTEKAFEVSEHLSNLQFSPEDTEPKNRENIASTQNQLPAETKENEALDVHQMRNKIHTHTHTHIYIDR